MQQHDVIKAIEAHAQDFGILKGSIGQMAVQNRHAYDRIKKGSASIDTMQRVVAWIEEDRARRETSKAGAA